MSFRKKEEYSNKNGRQRVGIVVLKREEYNKELNRLFGDMNTYRKLRDKNVKPL